MVQSPRHNKRFRNGECMSGSVHKRSDTGAYYVQWYDEKTGRQVKVYRYRGEKIFSKSTAAKLLAQMQGDAERGVFDLANYTGAQTDVIPFLDEWIAAVGPGLAPATLKGYKSYLKCHLKPFFKSNPVPLVEVRLDVLTKLLNAIAGKSGAFKLKVMYCMHAALDFAWRSGKIVAVPPFPKRNLYQIQEPEVKWMPSDRQQKILDAIPEEHKPIFYWLKYHLRRPGEAMALHREDYREVDDVFIVKRSISARKEIERTKSKQVHIAPCVDAFKPYLRQALRAPIISPFLFTNASSKLPGKRYSHTVLRDILKAACLAVGEGFIGLYQFTKHSGFTQLAVEEGYSDSELQVAGGHADIRSVKKYRALVMSARKRLLERKKGAEVIPMKAPKAS